MESAVSGCPRWAGLESLGDWNWNPQFQETLEKTNVLSASSEHIVLILKEHELSQLTNVLSCFIHFFVNNMSHSLMACMWHVDKLCILVVMLSLCASGYGKPNWNRMCPLYGKGTNSCNILTTLHPQQTNTQSHTVTQSHTNTHTHTLSPVKWGEETLVLYLVQVRDYNSKPRRLYTQRVFGDNPNQDLSPDWSLVLPSGHSSCWDILI